MTMPKRMRKCAIAAVKSRRQPERFVTSLLVTERLGVFARAQVMPQSHCHSASPHRGRCGLVHIVSRHTVGSNNAEL